MRKASKVLITAALFAPIFSGCEQDPLIPLAQTQCPAGAAMISVADGYLQTLCGCAEPSPAYFAPGERLLCTVTAGTMVLFHYLPTTLNHQILPTGTPSFPPSAPSRLEDGAAMIRVHPVKLDTPGTYGFEDGYNTSLAGDIVAL